MTGSTVSVYLEPECVRWLGEQRNRSIVINDLIKERMESELNLNSLRKMVSLLESNRLEISTKIDNLYQKIKLLADQEEEIKAAEKEKIANILAEKSREKMEKFKKIESSPYFKEIKVMKEYDDAKALRIIEKCRNAGNRDFGTYDIKEYIEGHND